jgi:outer membrane protein assembly factor BamB
MRWHIALLVLLLLVPLVAEYRASPSPVYPQLGYNPQHTGLSPWSGPQTSNLYLSVLVSQTQYGIWGKAVDANGAIYVGSDDGNFYAINPDGTIKWTLTGILGKNCYPATPAIGSDGTIYIGSDKSNYLYTINPDGTIKWKYGPVNLSTDGDYYIPAVTIGPDGTIYINANNGYVYAVNPDGTLKWKYGVGSTVYPVAVDPSTGVIYFGSYNKYLYALNPDGTLKWKYLCADAPSIPAIGPDGTVYVGDMYGYVYAIKPDGTLKWRYGQVTYSYYGWTMAAVMQNPAIGPDGTVYIVADCGWLYAIKPDGTLKWRYAVEGAPSLDGFYYGTGPVVGADGTVYVGDRVKGYVYALNPDGTLKWRWLDPINYPLANLVITDRGLLLASDYAGYLYALGFPSNLASPSVTVNVDKAVAKPNDAVRVYGTASSPNGPIASVVVSAKSAYGRTSVGCTASISGNSWSCALSIPPFPDAGTYTVYATAKDSWGASSTAKANFTVLGVPWPTQNGYYHTGLSPFVGPKNPKVAWVFKTGSKFSFGNRSIVEVASSDINFAFLSRHPEFFIVRDDSLYFSGSISSSAYTYNFSSGASVSLYYSYTLSALNPSNLKVSLLTTSVGTFRIGSDGTIFSVEFDGARYSRVKALSPTYSTPVKWYSNSLLGAMVGFAVTGDTVYLETADPATKPYQLYLYAIDVPTGSTKWTLTLGKANSGPPSKKGVFLGGFDLESYPWLAVSPSGAIYAVSGTTVYVVNPDGTVKRTVSLGTSAKEPVYIQAVSPAGNVYVQENTSKCDIIKPDGTLSSLNRNCPLLVDENGNMYYNNASYDASGNLRWENDLFRSDDLQATFRLAVTPMYFLEPRHSYSFSFLVGVAESTPLQPYGGMIYVITKDGIVAGSTPLMYVTPSVDFDWPVWALPSADWSSIYIAYHKSDWDVYVVKVPIDSLNTLIRNGDLAMPSPAVDADGTVYIGYYDGNLYAIGPDGKLKWSFHTNDWIVSAPTIGPDGTIYVGSLDGYIYAISRDGTLKWKYNTGGWITASPEVSSNGTVFVGSWGGSDQLYLLTPTGTLKAKYALMGRPSSLLLDENLSILYVSTWDGVIYAINYTQLKYTDLRGYEFFGSLALSPSSTPSQRNLYVSGMWGFAPQAKCYQLQVGNPSQLKLSEATYMDTEPNEKGFIAVDKDGNIVATYRQYGAGYLYSPALNAKVKLPAPPLAPPSTDADGYIYVGDSQGNLYSFGRSVRFNPETGYNELTPRWFIKLDGMIIAPPVVTYDGMYVVALDELAVYKIVNSTIAPTPVPKISVALAPDYSLWALLLVAMCVAGFAFASRGKIVLGISFIASAIAVYYVILKPFVSLQTLITQAQQLLSNAFAQIPLGPILPLIIAVAGIAVLVKVLRR